MNITMESNTQGTSKFSQVNEGEVIWNKVLQYLQQEYGQTIYENWISNLKFQSLSDGMLTIVAPTKFIREWIITNYFNKIKSLSEMIDPSIKKIDIRIQDTTESKENLTIRTAESDKIENRNYTYNYDSIASNLDQRFVFDNFITGGSNQMAYAAAKSFATYDLNNQINNNALYIHSAVGMGKTHLLQSIAYHINTFYPQKKVAYLSAEKFMHQYILAIRSNQLLPFRDKLLSFDILLLDDIQFICGKVSTQKEFTNTFDAFTEANKRIIVAADQSPYTLELDVRTKSRLASSIVAEIQSSNFSLRLEILKSKANLFKLNILSNILDFIAENITSSIRELDGALNKIITHCSLTNKPISLENTKNILRDCLRAHESNITINQIIDTIANFYNISKSEIISKSKLSKLVYIRQLTAYLAKDLTDLSLQLIGKSIGGRDHATVIYSIKRFEEKMMNNPSVRSEVGLIKDAINSI